MYIQIFVEIVLSYMKCTNSRSQWRVPGWQRKQRNSYSSTKSVPVPNSQFRTTGWLWTFFIFQVLLDVNLSTMAVVNIITISRPPICVQKVQYRISTTGAQGLCKKLKGKSFWGAFKCFGHHDLMTTYLLLFLAHLIVCSLPFLLAAVSPFFFMFGCCLCICWFLQWFLWPWLVVLFCSGQWFLLLLLLWLVVLGVVNAVVMVLLLVVVLAVVGGSGCCFLAVVTAAVTCSGCFCCCSWLFWLFLLLWSVVLAVFAATVGPSDDLQVIILAIVDVTVIG